MSVDVILKRIDDGRYIAEVWADKLLVGWTDHKEDARVFGPCEAVLVEQIVDGLATNCFSAPDGIPVVAIDADPSDEDDLDGLTEHGEELEDLIAETLQEEIAKEQGYAGADELREEIDKMIIEDLKKAAKKMQEDDFDRSMEGL